MPLLSIVLEMEAFVPELLHLADGPSNRGIAYNQLGPKRLCYIQPGKGDDTGILRSARSNECPEHL